MFRSAWQCIERDGSVQKGMAMYRRAWQCTKGHGNVLKGMAMYKSMTSAMISFQ